MPSGQVSIVDLHGAVDSPRSATRVDCRSAGRVASCYRCVPATPHPTLSHRERAKADQRLRPGITGNALSLWERAGVRATAQPVTALRDAGVAMQARRHAGQRIRNGCIYSGRSDLLCTAVLAEQGGDFIIAEFQCYSQRPLPVIVFRIHRCAFFKQQGGGVAGVFICGPM